MILESDFGYLHSTVRNLTGIINFTRIYISGNRNLSRSLEESRKNVTALKVKSIRVLMHLIFVIIVLGDIFSLEWPFVIRSGFNIGRWLPLVFA